MKYPGEVQSELFSSLIDQAALTRFGLEHKFSQIKTVEDFKKAVPIRNYEAFLPYIDMMREGQQNVSWPTRRLETTAPSAGLKKRTSPY